MAPARFTFAPLVAATLFAPVALAAPQVQPQGTFLAQNNLLVIQFETAPIVDDWVLSTSTGGFTGDGYFVWNGANFFDDPGEEGVFSFAFEVEQSGTYQLRVRNRHEDPDPTEENDVWVRMDNGSWIKLFSNMPSSVGAWTWESTFEAGGGMFPDASYNLNAGTHTISFSARSFGFKMDRFHLYRDGTSNPLNLSLPQSPRRFGDASCTAADNSTGGPSELVAIGSPEVADNDVTLQCTDLPLASLGYFIVSQTPVFVPNAGGSSGNLCVAGQIGRYAGNILSSGASGEVSFQINVNSIPRPTMSVAAQAGETWYFQYWHRDVDLMGPTSNFSPAIEIEFE